MAVVISESNGGITTSACPPAKTRRMIAATAHGSAFPTPDCRGANPAGESPKDISTVHFDFDIGQTILKNYLAETRGFLTQHDYDYLYDAIRLIPFELGLRFLTDHLEGNHYFKTEWPGQNLHRALVQFELTTNIEKHEPAIKAVIASLVAR